MQTIEKTSKQKDNRVIVFMRQGMKNNLKNQVKMLKKQGYKDASMSAVLAVIYAEYIKENDINKLKQLLIKANKI